MLFHNENIQYTRNRRKLPQHVKGRVQKATANGTINNEK